MHVDLRIAIRGLLVGIFTRVACAIPDTTLCGQYQNVTDQSSVYSFSTNVWGLDDSGSSCIEVYDNATSMSSTWAWRSNQTLVHAYPNINYNPIQRDPIQLSNLSSLDVKLSWSMKPELSTSTRGLDTSGLATANTKANVAIDVFFDEDITRAVNTTAPRYEVMVWIGQVGSILPIGTTDKDTTKKRTKQKIGRDDFYLYEGSNDNGQYVYSWVANSNHTVFDSDISPLIHYLWRNGLVLASNYIGVVQIGTEQKHATSNVSFFMGEFSIDAVKGIPKDSGVAQRGAPSITLLGVFVAVAYLTQVW